MKNILQEFDQYLKSKGLKFSATIIGGAALNIMDVTTRVTKDVDCIDPEIPKEIKEASINFAKENPQLKLNPDKWINNGPITILKDLHNDWKFKTKVIFNGDALTLYTLDRISLLKTKLYAYCDRDTDFDDCLKLMPTADELMKCYDWVLKGDANELWPEHVKSQFKILKKVLGHEK
jgi:hypothetical protein